MEQQIREILAHTVHSDTGVPILDIAEITNISEGDGFIRLQLQFDSISAEDKRAIRQVVENALKEQGIEALVSIVSKERQQATQKQASPLQEFIPSEIFHNFKNIIAVYSTKGGVGKSTVAVNLALELADKALKVAILDLDIYGPSVPRLLGFNDKPTFFENKFVPVEIHDIHMMSIGALIPEPDSPLIWRAPIANGAIKQMFAETVWDSDYDVLVIDMPPGTGDIPIAVAQSIPINGFVCVSGSQGVALEDTIKGIAMLKKFEKEIYGIVFNMSSVICPDCKKMIPIFPKNQECLNWLSNAKIQPLSDLPLDSDVAHKADQGTMNEIDDSSLWKQEFAKITDTVYRKLSLS